MDKDKTPDNAGVRVPPPLIYLGLLVLGLWYDSPWFEGRLAEMSATIGGGIFAALGLALMMISAPRHKQAGTDIKPWKPTTTIITTGVYGWSRNPIYLGMAIAHGGLAIAGAPPFAVFLSEFSIFRAGLAGGHYIAITLLGIFILMAFAAVMFHINGMVFGRPPEDSVKVALPKTAVISLTLALVPVIVLGLYIPDSLYKLLHLAAASLGR